MSNEFVRILGTDNLVISSATTTQGTDTSALYMLPVLLTPFTTGITQSMATPGAALPYDAVYFLDGLRNEDGTAYVQGAGSICANMPMVYDDTDGFWRPKYATNEAAAFAEQTLATGSSTVTLGTVNNTRDYDGCALTFVIAGMTAGTDIIQIKITSNADTYTILLSDIIGQDGTYTLKIHPGFPTQPGTVANDQVPRQLKIACFYSVSGDTTVNCDINWFN